MFAMFYWISNLGGSTIWSDTSFLPPPFFFCFLFFVPDRSTPLVRCLFLLELMAAEMSRFSSNCKTSNIIYWFELFEMLLEAFVLFSADFPQTTIKRFAEIIASDEQTARESFLSHCSIHRTLVHNLLRAARGHSAFHRITFHSDLRYQL